MSFKDSRVWESYKQYFFLTLEIKDYNTTIDKRNFFDQSVKYDLRTYDNIGKITIGQGDDCATGCLLDYPCFKKHYKLNAIDLKRQQKLDADPKAMQEINFTRNLVSAGNAQMFFIIEEAKETVLDFSKGIVKVLWFFSFNIILI